MPDEKHYRHELKYSVSFADYISMRARLRAVMESDLHADANGRYLVRSIYFDNSDDKVLREKIDGTNNREKFRIRYYNDDLSYIALEKKTKTGRLCTKESVVISEDEFRRILSGDVLFMRDHDEALLRELHAKMNYQRLKPRLLVSYVREPYIYKAGNVRVTFDSKIRTSLFDREFINRKMSDISATDTPQDMILEIKYDAFLPEIIQDIIQVPELRQEAFSKYGVSRRFG